MKNKDWVGNENSIYTTLGASNHSDYIRADYDFYATPPEAIDFLIKDGGACVASNVLEPCAGNGHISEKLKEYGINVISKDIIQREYPLNSVEDFLKCNEKFNGDIITNPPYKFAKEFIEKSLEIIPDGNKVFMFLKLQFLEGKARRKLFDTHQLEKVYVFTSRMKCGANGNFDIGGSSAVAYAWFEFTKGYNKYPTIKWIN